MRWINYILTGCVLAGMSACEEDPFVVPAGTVRLIINVNHHGVAIPNAVLFRKNDTLGWPGTDTSLYDARYVADANGNFTIADLGNGEKKITIYAKGIDPSWDSTGTTPVHGYQFVQINTATGESKDVTMEIPVSE